MVGTKELRNVSWRGLVVLRIGSKYNIYSSLYTLTMIGLEKNWRPPYIEPANQDKQTAVNFTSGFPREQPAFRNLHVLILSNFKGCFKHCIQSWKQMNTNSSKLKQNLSLFECFYQKSWNQIWFQSVVTLFK